MIKAPKCTISVGKETYGGKTISEARQAALDHLAKFMDGAGFIPELIPTSKGHTGVVFRDATGFWAYYIQWAEENGSRRGCVNAGTWSRATAEARLRAHLAQAVFTPGGSRAESLALLPGEHYRDQRADFERWANFQDAYKYARDAGKTDNEARKIAGQVA